MKSRPPRLTPKLLEAITTLVDMAEDNSCSCVTGGQTTGYHRHARDCWVHRYREEFKRVRKFLAAARA